MLPILTIVISLKRSENRRAQCKRILKNSGLDWEILDAIDGLQLQSTPPEYHEEKVIRLLGFPLSASEIGCFLSHRLAWARSIEKNQLTLILEDDFSFEPHFEQALATLSKTYQDWDIVRLQGLEKTSDSTLIEMDGFRAVKNYRDPLGATAYLIKPSAAIRLIKCSQDIYEPLDHFIEHHQKHGLKIIAIKPYPVIVNGASSTIHDRPTRKPIKGLRKWMRSLSRKLDRLMNPNPWFPK
jgi:glycosyl transferase family 25